MVDIEEDGRDGLLRSIGPVDLTIEAEAIINPGIEVKPLAEQIEVVLLAGEPAIVLGTSLPAELAAELGDDIVVREMDTLQKVERIMGCVAGLLEVAEVIVEEQRLPRLRHLRRRAGNRRVRRERRCHDRPAGLGTDVLARRADLKEYRGSWRWLTPLQAGLPDAKPAPFANAGSLLAFGCIAPNESTGPVATDSPGEATGVPGGVPLGSSGAGERLPGSDAVPLWTGGPGVSAMSIAARTKRGRDASGQSSHLSPSLAKGPQDIISIRRAR